MAFQSARRDVPAVNAGSMADIAFLLLIFFLVTTTIEQDSGVLVKLPEWSDDPPKTLTSQVLTVQVNADNALMVEGTRTSPDELPELLAEFVMAPERTPKQAVVSLLHDRSTDYQTYMHVYDMLLAGYRRLWDGAAQREYGIAYEMLGEDRQRAIRSNIPLVISEAEPSDSVRD